MMRILYSALIGIALLANASAQTGKSKIECAGSGITTIVEIDFDSRLVRVRENNGPSRRSSAKITKDKITWLVVKSVGSASSRTVYTLDRKSRTLSVVPGNGKRLDSPCTDS